MVCCYLKRDGRIPVVMRRTVFGAFSLRHTYGSLRHVKKYAHHQFARSEGSFLSSACPITFESPSLTGVQVRPVWNRPTACSPGAPGCRSCRVGDFGTGKGGSRSDEDLLPSWSTIFCEAGDVSGYPHRSRMAYEQQHYMPRDASRRTCEDPAADAGICSDGMWLRRALRIRVQRARPRPAVGEQNAGSDENEEEKHTGYRCEWKAFTYPGRL